MTCSTVIHSWKTIVRLIVNSLFYQQRYLGTSTKPSFRDRTMLSNIKQTLYCPLKPPLSNCFVSFFLNVSFQICMSYETGINAQNLRQHRGYYTSAMGFMCAVGYIEIARFIYLCDSTYFCVLLGN